MLEGFVTIGRGELLLSLLSVALLMCVLGYAVGQIVLMSKRPKPLKLQRPTPERQKAMDDAVRKWCKGLHCDDAEQLEQWLRRKDYSLITNEMLHELTSAAAFDGVAPPVTPTIRWPEGDRDGV